MPLDDVVSRQGPPDTGKSRAETASIQEKERRGSRLLLSLTVRDYRTVLAGATGAFIARQIDLVATGYLAYSITNSAVAIGVIQLAWGITALLFSLIAGAIVDRRDKRSILIIVQSLSGISAFTIAVLLATNQIQVWHLVVASLLQGLVFACQMPARQSIVRELVGKARLSNAVALYNVAFNFSGIVGPSIAGSLIDAPWFGMANTYFLMAGIYAVVVIATMRLPSFPRRGSGAKESIVGSVTSGLTFLRRDHLLQMMIGIAVVPMMLGLPYQALLPVFSEQVLAVGAEGLGHLYSVAGIGALLGAFVIASIRTIDNKIAVQLVLAVLFGVTLVLFGLSRDYWTALSLVFLVGTCGMSLLTLCDISIMTHTPQEFYGRVMSVYVLSCSVTPLATLPLSGLADAIGVATTLIISGSLIVMFMVGIAVLNPSWRAKRGEMA